MLGQLPDEGGEDGVAEPAAEEFRRRVAAVMFRIVTLSRVIKDAAGTEQIKEARSVIGWCRVFAKPGQWQPIRDYCAWSRQVGIEKVLAVAIRVELAGQVGDGSFRGMFHRRLADLAVRYGVAVAAAGECRPGGRRAIELSRNFIESLVGGPDPVVDAGVDGAVLRNTLARGTSTGMMEG
jgi:hypothetical protein